MELEEIVAPGFSVGRLMVPRFWTVDFQSHYVPSSVPSKMATVGDDGAADACIADDLACRLTCSNTMRAERLDRSGDTLYVTEVYIPRSGSSSDSVAALTKLQETRLLAVPPRSQERPPVQVWVRNLEEYRKASNFSGSESLAQLVLSSCHVFLQVVLDVYEGPSREMVAMVEAILNDTLEKYTNALANLCTLPLRRDAGRGRGGNPDRTPASQQSSDEGLLDNRWWSTSRAKLTGEEDPAFHAGVYTKKGGAVVSTLPLLTDAGSKGKPTGEAVSAYSVAWNSGRPHGGSRARVGEKESAARLRHFAKHEMRLSVGEDLTFALEVEAKSPQPLRAVTVATLPLFTAAPSLSSSPVCSLHNYLSVEHAFEHHVRTSLLANQRHHTNGSSTHGTGWELLKVRTSDRFVTSDTYMQAVASVLEEEIALQLSLDTVPNQPLPPVPIRNTLYVLREKGKEDVHTAIVARLIAPRVQSDSAIVLLGLADGLADGAMTEASLASLAELFADMFTVEYPATSTWTSVIRLPVPVPSSRGGRKDEDGGGGGFLFREGQLVLRVLAGDARYHKVRVFPTAGAAFTTLGSLTIVAGAELSVRASAGSSDDAAAVPSSSSAASSPTTSPALVATDTVPPSFSLLAATWTLLADGRSAADYLDFVLSEAYYDSGVFNLNNVAQRTTALKVHEATLRVRERGRNACHKMKLLQQRRAGGTAGGASTTAASLTEGEVWSAWVDVGDACRLFLATQERDVGQVLLIQAAIATPRPVTDEKKNTVANPDSGVAGASGIRTQGTAESRQESELEAWVFGVMVGTLPRY